MGKPDIVWITVDSVRYDRTSLSEKNQNTTPTFSTLARKEQAKSFNDSHAHGIWTRASTASMLTGTYVSHHQTGLSITDKLPSDLPTVPELLSEVGYHSICISHNTHITTESGLARGFNEYYPMMGKKALSTSPLSSKLKYGLRLFSDGGGLTTDTRRHPMSYVITELGKSVVRDCNEPTFLYAHYNDVHLPYLPPVNRISDYLEESISSSEATELAIDMSENLHEKIAQDNPFDESEWSTLKALYDAILRYTDEQIGQLIEHVQRTLDDPVIVLTADHGEFFGEHGLLSHILKTDTAVSKVPLVVAGPTEIVNHEEDRVQHLDVISTLLQEVGAPTDSLQGINLRNNKREMSITQRGWPRAERNIREIVSKGNQYIENKIRSGMLSTFRTSEYRYDIWEDGEQIKRATADAEPEMQDKLPSMASSFLEGPGAPRGKREEVNLSENARSRLSHMGYLVD